MSTTRPTEASDATALFSMWQGVRPATLPRRTALVDRIPGTRWPSFGGPTMAITLPDPSLVLLIGTSGSGKSTFAQAHFRPSQVLSSDHYRGVVADDPNDQSATGDAFDILHFIADRRLKAGRLTVIDATNLLRIDRAPLLAIARAHDAPAVAILLDVPESVCQARNRVRSDRSLPENVIHTQRLALDQAIGDLDREGYAWVWLLAADAPDAVALAPRVTRTARQPD